MLYEEFLTITNLTEDDITVWTYENLVEPMYMAAPDSMDKHEFIKLLNLETLTTQYPNKNNVIRQIEKVAAECKLCYGHTSINGLKQKLYSLVNELVVRYENADTAQVRIYGDNAYTMTTISIHIIKWTDYRHNDIRWEKFYRIDATKDVIKLIREFEY